MTQSKKRDTTLSEESLAYLRLARTEGLGPVTMTRMIQAFGKASRALNELPKLISSGRARRVKKVCTLAEAKKEIDALADIGGSIMTPVDEDYPPLLKHVDDRPQVLSVLGHRALCRKKMIAVVGTRFMSPHGELITTEWTKEFGKAGFLVVSGLARGIDAAAHKASSDFGGLAVLPGGVDVVYPKENRNLYEALIKNGAVLSEMPLGMPPTTYHFPKRNRIVAAMARATVIIEAARKSGALITAKLAFDYGRELFAVPGSPKNERSAGCNELISLSMAQLADSYKTVLDALDKTTIQEPKFSFDSIEGPADSFEEEMLAEKDMKKLEDYLLEVITDTPLGVDDLYEFVCRHYGELPFRALVITLVRLDLAGAIIFVPGNQVVLGKNISEA